MKMNRNVLRLFTILAALLATFTMYDAAAAQPREVRGRAMTKPQVKAIIVRVEDRVDNFRSNFDRSLDHSKLNGSSREDWLMKRARDLESATDELSREFDKRDAWSENREEVRRCLNIASDIDRSVRNRAFGSVTENNWARVRFELNSLADAYNMPRVGAAAYK